MIPLGVRLRLSTDSEEISMALTGLQIQRLLPGTNCRECGSNTCLAFAMRLAAKKAELALCPYASPEAQRILGEANEPPVRTISLGRGGKTLIGGETVLYRHEKSFVNPTALAVNLCDDESSAAVQETLEKIRDYTFRRVGENFGVDMVALTQRGDDGASFLSLARRALDLTGRPLVLRSGSLESLREAAASFSGERCVLCAQSPETARTLAPVAAEHGHALSIRAEDIDGLVACASGLREKGFHDVVLEMPSHTLAEGFQANSLVRRAAIKNGVKPLGFPFIRFIENGDMLEETVGAVTEIAKYGGICVLPSFDPALLSALLTLRLNIYTDPQKPIQVEPSLYAIGEPSADSPLFVTTNFSLTYFVVSAEIENCGIDAWLLVPECEGMSVLTAWAAGKFTAATIAKFMKEIGVEGRLSRREIVIPGYVAQISGELEEKIPGWRVMIGPQEASDLEGFIKTSVAT